MPNLCRITPILAVHNVDAAVRFFVDLLGFHAWVHDRDYAYVQREAAAVRIGKASTGAEERIDHGPRAFLFYIEVEDIAAIHEEISPKLHAAGFQPCQGPKDQTWGQREWWIPGPEGGLIVFGQEVVAMPFIPPPAK